MKNALLALGLFFTVAVHAESTLLECDTTFGPDQAVTVKKDGQVLKLIELTSKGGLETRVLSQEEWNSHVLNLREEFGYTATLKIYAADDVVVHVTDGSKYNEYGPAECSVAK